MADDGWHVGSAVFGSHSKSTSKARTSLTHPLQIATIPVGDKGGRIGITFCPGKKGPSVFGASWDRDLTADVEAIRTWGASSVVTLIEPFEFDMLGVKALPQTIRDAGMDWLYAPIEDVSIPGPSFDAAWRTIGPCLTKDITQGRSVVVHCRGGLGRAGLVAAKLLVAMGEKPLTAIKRVRHTRPGAIETSDQERYVLGLVPNRG